jgi:hypothetical protein
MNKIKIIITLIAFLAIAYVAYEFYQIGSLVRSKPESQEQYDHISKRISILTIYNGKKLDSLIANFLKKHTNYIIPDSIKQSNKSDLSEYNGYPLSFFNQIYFNNNPTEIYFLTFEYGDNQDLIIDMVSYSKDYWKPVLSSKLDSLEKRRIINRINSEILQNLDSNSTN